jgi:hypothetical protein
LIIEGFFQVFIFVARGLEKQALLLAIRPGNPAIGQDIQVERLHFLSRDCGYDFPGRQDPVPGQQGAADTPAFRTRGEKLPPVLLFFHKFLLFYARLFEPGGVDVETYARERVPAIGKRAEITDSYGFLMPSAGILAMPSAFLL